MVQKIEKRPVDPNALKVAEDLLKAVKAGLVDNVMVAGYHSELGAVTDMGAMTPAGLVMLKTLHEKQQRTLTDHTFQVLTQSVQEQTSQVKTPPKPQLVI